MVVLRRDKDSLMYEKDLVLAMVAGKQALIPIVKFLINQEQLKRKGGYFEGNCPPELR